MKKLFWKAALHLLRQLSSTDINEQLLRENEFLHAELQVIKAQVSASKKRLRFTDEQRRLLAEKGKAIGKRLYDLASIVRPETVLRWHRELVAKKFDSSQSPRKVGRPPTPQDIEKLILQMAKDNPFWGYLRIAGSLKNLGYKISKSTVSSILKTNGINPSGDRKHGGMSWAEFLGLHMDVMWATDFFTTEVWTTFGLITYYVLFFIHLGSRKVIIAGITPNPSDEWMTQIARNLTGYDGELADAKYLIHDGDKKYTEQFDSILESIGIKPIRLPPFSPNLNCYAENFVGKIKSESLDHIIFVGENSLRKAVTSYVEFYLHERNHQGLENTIPFPDEYVCPNEGEIKCKERLGGLLKYYYRKAA